MKLHIRRGHPSALALACLLIAPALRAQEEPASAPATPAEQPGVPAAPPYPFSCTIEAAVREETQTSRPAETRVQLALLLDTSGSMNGLINQARAQLWDIVNEFIRAKRNGVPPAVEVALYEYGNSGLSSADNWIRCVVPLTRDLDEVSRRLFELTTNGGEEYCGAAVAHAVSRLDWSREPGVYRAVFIAGNEPFTQGPVDAVESCRQAVAQGIIVNTILCGSADEATIEEWRSGATAADGRFLTIDHNQAVANVAAPQDAEIIRLSSELNETYIPYGRNGQEEARNQIAQDSNAAGLAPAAAVGRAVTKASGLYYNARWDLVDAIVRNGADPGSVDRHLLPESLQSLDPEELKRHVEGQAEKRRSLQQRIQELHAEREAFLAGHRSVQDDSLENAVRTAVREQAAKQGLVWESK